MATYTYTYTATMVAITVTGLSPGDHMEIVVRPEPATGVLIVDDFPVVGDDTTGSEVYVYSGLNPGTSYAMNVRVAPEGTAINTISWPAAKYFTTTALYSSFTWVYAGLDTDGKPVLGGEKVKGLGLYVTADEWNEFIAFVNYQYGMSLDTVSKGDTITADIVNQAAVMVGVDVVYKGDIITAEYFNSLKDSINNTI